MRLAALVLGLGLIAAPAAAQPLLDCEASASGKFGEVIALQQREKVGERKVTPVTVTWAVERKEGVGEESDHFARPALELDFKVGDDGAMTPSRAIVSISRYRDKDIGAPPPISAVSVRASPKGGAAMTWPADKAPDGEKDLARQLAQVWPGELKLDLLVAGKVVASATFDLSKRAEAEKSARGVVAEAVAKCAAA